MKQMLKYEVPPTDMFALGMPEKAPLSSRKAHNGAWARRWCLPTAPWRADTPSG